MLYLELIAKGIAQFMYEEEMPFWQIEAMMELEKIPLRHRDDLKKLISEELSKLQQLK